jgi:hypothetical protein
MRCFVILAAILAICIAPATAQSNAPARADPRAVESCKASSSTFVQLESCLPDAHVAFRTLDAFSEIYPPDAATLKTRCIELNDDVVGALACVTTAIEAAIRLKQSLPDGSALDDAVFHAVAEPALLVRLEQVEKEAKAAFPEKRMWGGGMYRQYK